MGPVSTPGGDRTWHASTAAQCGGCAVAHVYADEALAKAALSSLPPSFFLLLFSPPSASRLSPHAHTSPQASARTHTFQQFSNSSARARRFSSGSAHLRRLLRLSLIEPTVCLQRQSFSWIMEQDNGVSPAADTVEEGKPELAILFVGVCLVIGLVCRHVLRGTKVPYTVVLLILGIALGAADYGTHGALGALGQSTHLWSRISPSLILFAFLPSLLFESSFAMEVHQIKRCLMQMVLLAGPGVVISTFCTGTLIHYAFPYEWTWSVCLLLGGLLSATDPVAVVALLRDLGASKKLNTLIEGESLMNDGTAIVIFRLFLELVVGHSFNAETVVAYLSRVALGGVALGLAFGLISVLWLGFVFNDTVIEITLTLTASYIAYYTAEDELGVSGVLAVMTVGISFAVFARAAFKGETQQSMHYFWEMVAYIANTLIFILSGVVIAEYILRGQDNVEGKDWGYLVLLYTFLLLSRVIVVITLLPGLKYFGHGLTWKEASILTWAGLRGAVALALSLSVNAIEAKDSQGNIILPEKTRARFVFLTGGVVFLTLTINGSTTQILLHLLKLQNTPDVKLRILEYTKHEMNMKALEAFEELGEDEELGPADWQTVTKYISCLATSNQLRHPHDIESRVEGNREIQLQDTRLRLLNGVQAAYWTMVEERRLTQTVALILMQSVDEALDRAVKDEVLADWKGLEPYVQFPTYFKALWLCSSGMIPKGLLNRIVIGQLEFGCHVSAAFLRAHRSARRQLREFIGESDIAEAIIRESEAEEAPAKTFLEDVRLTYPEVLRAVKTKQVSHAVLNHLIEYVQGLEKVGLLEERETDHLHDIIQADLKRLLRNPPLVKMPSTLDTLRGHPFLGAQPTEIQDLLVNSAKETMKLRDSLLYKEDKRADGIYLLTNGVVQWNNRESAGKHLLHPTFSHGSTLGLYEVLTGKPYLCDMRADSVVHCFFLEASHVISVLRTRPEVEDFFWKESSLAVAKILLPEHFEDIAMQELRTLVMERTIIRTYLRGEIIDVLPGKVGFLLEGFLKQEGNDDIIVAPCALTKNCGETCQGRQDSLLHQDAVYHVETRSRIAVLDLSVPYRQLQRASTSLMSSAILLASSSSFEHEGLMRWPKIRRPSDPQIAGLYDQHLSSLNSAAKVFRKGRGLRSQSWIESNGGRVSLIPSWMESNGGRVSLIPSMHSSSQASVLHRKGHLSTSVLPRPRTKTRSFSEGESSTQQQACGNQSKGSSSDESGGDEDHIIRIDSPSSLFQHHLAH